MLTALIAVAKAQVWRTGRATHYGEDHTGQTDGYSIHDGSCQFGNLDPNIGTGWVRLLNLRPRLFELG